MSEQEPTVVSNEFAHVVITVRHDGNGPVLHLQDARSGAFREFDALMLESLIWVGEDLLSQLVDPQSIPDWK